MQFDLMCVYFPHMTDLRWIYSNVKINSESIGGVVFPDKAGWANSSEKTTLPMNLELFFTVENILFKYFM